ncbi:hypothetical protein BDA96_04G240300 [Sorghum bicolor]|uniref:Uncharacterized protein n=2 Tax=Sorghum bicolor TaxID=4558 RepID=A0A921R4K5_SORBI|nr:hypothetical protein BDA96_04G240300 [Sorghum bicolor]OQU85368.1 hypothetical protein SORBI_3004G225550 [Sorghum bicolor]
METVPSIATTARETMSMSMSRIADLQHDDAATAQLPLFGWTWICWIAQVETGFLNRDVLRKEAVQGCRQKNSQRWRPVTKGPLHCIASN